MKALQLLWRCIARNTLSDLPLSDNQVIFVTQKYKNNSLFIERKYARIFVRGR